MSRRGGAAALLAGFAVWAAAAGADTLDAAVTAARDDVRTATADLLEARARIADRLRPLAAETEALQREVAALRREVAAQQREARRQATERRHLEADIGVRAAEWRAVEQAVSEYRRGLETRFSRAESLARASALDALDEWLAAASAWEALPGAVEAVFDASREWREARLGGTGWRGACLDAEGLRLEGWFLSAGPAVWFVADDGTRAGPVVTRPGSALPSLAAGLRRPGVEVYRQATRGEEAWLPVDLAGGEALQHMAARTGWIERIRAGGTVMIPLLLVAVVVGILATRKMLALARVRVDGEETVTGVAEALRSGDVAGARARAAAAGAPLREVLLEGVEHAGTDRETLEELLHERVLTALPGLERHLGALAVLGGVAPLLGLLGTVTGMIHTFRMVTLFGTGDARLLSGGISEALVTTQFGLLIAIPTLLLHAYLVRRVQGLVGRLEESAIALVHGIKGGNAAS